MPNSAECLAALFGTALAGATVVPINARFKAPEMRHILADSAAKVVLTSDLMDAHANLSDQLRAATTDVPIVLLGAKVEPGLIGEAEFDALGSATFERPQVGLRDTAMLLYTSGTTAQPRGCRISHDAIVRVWAGVADAMDITAADAVWNPCPMFHIAAIGVSISCVVVGATNVTTRFFNPDESVELLAAERPSVWYPAYDRIMLGVVNHPRFGEIDLSGLKSVLAVGQPDTLRRLQAAVPDAKLVSTFGMTESAGCAVISRVDDPERRADGDRRRPGRRPRGAARRRRRDPAARPAAVRRLPQRGCRRRSTTAGSEPAISEPRCTGGSRSAGARRRCCASAARTSRPRRSRRR